MEIAKHKFDEHDNEDLSLDEQDPKRNQWKIITAIGLGVVCPFFGFLLFTVGYFGLMWLLYSLELPFLHYNSLSGQFSMIVFITGPIGILYGASFAFLPYTKFLYWLPVYGLMTLLFGVYWSSSVQPINENSFLEWQVFAMFLVVLTVPLFAFVINSIIRFVRSGK